MKNAIFPISYIICAFVSFVIAAALAGALAGGFAADLPSDPTLLILSILTCLTGYVAFVFREPNKFVRITAWILIFVAATILIMSGYASAAAKRIFDPIIAKQMAMNFWYSLPVPLVMLLVAVPALRLPKSSNSV
jgi:hypothetical protein